MTRWVWLIGSVILWSLSTSGGAWAVSCSASAVPVVFAPVETATSAIGTGGIDVSCGGGTGSEEVFICLTLGSGNGGSAGNGTNQRFLASAQSTPAYSLTTQGNAALGVGTKVGLGSLTLASGAKTGSFVINGSVDWAGYTGDPASLTSSFSADEVLMSYGATSDCLDGESQISSLSVTAAYHGACEVSASIMDFGTLSPSNPNATGKSDIFVTCPNATSYTVTLGAGENSGLSPVGTATRAMRNGTAYLGYDLYESFGAATPWDGVSGTGTAATQSINVFGRIPSGQSGLTAGTYADTVVVTVTY